MFSEGRKEGRKEGLMSDSVHNPVWTSCKDAAGIAGTLLSILTSFICFLFKANGPFVLFFDINLLDSEKQDISYGCIWGLVTASDFPFPSLFLTIWIATGTHVQFVQKGKGKKEDMCDLKFYACIGYFIFA